MSKHKVSFLFHPSITGKAEKIEIIVDDNTTFHEALLTALNQKSELYKRIVKNSKIMPGFLVLKGKEELNSTNQMNEKINEDCIIRLIPISHGG